MTTANSTADTASTPQPRMPCPPLAASSSVSTKRDSNDQIKSQIGSRSCCHQGGDCSTWYSGRARISPRRWRASSSPSPIIRQRWFGDLELEESLGDVGTLAAVTQIDEQQGVDDRSQAGEENLDR